MNILQKNRKLPFRDDTMDISGTANKLTGAAENNFFSKIVVNTIRKILNDSIRTVRPGQLVEAIRNNTSIWEVAGADIKSIASRVPRSVIVVGKPMYRKACQAYGSSTELVLLWLKEDNPMLFSLILNTEGGVAWFDHQVKELTTNLGLEDKE
jgi:hypothetical protein